MIKVYADYKNLTCNIFNTDILSEWRLKLEEYGTEIEQIQREKNIVADVLSQFLINGNQETTQEYTYAKQIMIEITDIEEWYESIFPINLKLIDKYQ